MGIMRIPEVIEKCSKLQKLRLRNNSIKSLPCGLLRMDHINIADLSENGVEHNLTISCNLKVQKFPTKFICQHLQSLQILSVSHQPSITSIGSCIEDMSRLSHLVLEDNGIVPEGVAPNIVHLQHLKMFEISGNPVYEHLQWRNANLGRTHQQKVSDFIIRHFSKHLKTLELDGNHFDDSHMIYNLSKSLPSLEIFNISNNNIESILLQKVPSIPTTVGQCAHEVKLEWKSLAVLDVSHNPLFGIDSNILQFFVTHQNSSQLLLQNTSLLAISMRNCELKRFPKVIIDALPKLGSLDVKTNSQMYVDDMIRVFMQIQYLKVLRVELSSEDSMVTKIPDCFKRLVVLHIVKKMATNISFKYKWRTFFSLELPLQALYIDVSEVNMSLVELNTFPNYSKITTLTFKGVRKRGPLPLYLDKTVPMAEHIDLEKCKLYGKIHAYNFSKLRNLVLADNELSGPIPKQILMNPELTFAKLHYNNLSGVVPKIPLFRLRQIECLMMHGNFALMEPLPDIYLQETEVITYISLPMKREEQNTYGFNLTRLQEKAKPPRMCTTRKDKKKGETYVACFTEGLIDASCNIKDE